MKISDLSIAVWRHCNACVNSSGRLFGGADCWKCRGFGKRPIYIPLSELDETYEDEDGFTRRPQNLVDQVTRWLERNRETESPDE